MSESVPLKDQRPKTLPEHIVWIPGYRNLGIQSYLHILDRREASPTTNREFQQDLYLTVAGMDSVLSKPVPEGHERFNQERQRRQAERVLLTFEAFGALNYPNIGTNVSSYTERLFLSFVAFFASDRSRFVYPLRSGLKGENLVTDPTLPIFEDDLREQMIKSGTRVSQTLRSSFGFGIPADPDTYWAGRVGLRGKVSKFNRAEDWAVIKY